MTARRARLLDGRRYPRRLLADAVVAVGLVVWLALDLANARTGGRSVVIYNGPTGECAVAGPTMGLPGCAR